MPKFLKSKTINFNALYLAAVAVLQACGFSFSADTIAAVQTLMNVVLRYLTKKPMSEK